MKASAKVKEFIKEHEGLCLSAIKCPAGVWTIGYGHTEGVKRGDVITAAQAAELFDKDITEFARLVSNTLGDVALKQHQFDALVSFAYNCGIGNLRRSTLLRKVKANADDPAIPDEFRRWTRAAGKVLRGLERRREAEARMYQGL